MINTKLDDEIIRMMTMQQNGFFDAFLTKKCNISGNGDSSFFSPEALEKDVRWFEAKVVLTSRRNSSYTANHPYGTSRCCAIP